MGIGVEDAVVVKENVDKSWNAVSSTCSRQDPRVLTNEGFVSGNGVDG